MKKLLVLLLAIMSVFTLVSCGENNGGGGDNGGTKKGVPGSVDPTFWDKDGSGIDDWQEKPITLKYATWQYNETALDSDTIDTLLISAFMAKYPNVTVEMQIVGEYYEWDEKMSALIETGDLPDVFLVNRLETGLGYKFLADITDLYDNDPDSQYIVQSMKTAGVFGGKRYAVPSFFYPEYWFVNKDILTEKGIEIPSYDWTWEQMEAIAQACYDESLHYAGQYDAKQYYRCLPKILSGNNSWQSFTYDGSKFNFDSKAFADAMELLADAVSTNAVTLPYSAEQLTEYFGSEGFMPNYGGKAAIWSSACWEAKGYFDTMNFNWDVYPAPGGTINGNIDLIGMSPTCTEREAAYQLLKWMSYGREGLTKRYELYANFGDLLFKSANNFPYPIVDYGFDSKTGEHIIWDSIPYEQVPGMKSYQMINAIKNSACWANKEVCGFDAVNSAIYQDLYDVVYGGATWADKKDLVVDVANSTLVEFQTKLVQLMNGEIDINDLFPEEEQDPEQGDPEQGDPEQGGQDQGGPLV